MSLIPALDVKALLTCGLQQIQLTDEFVSEAVDGLYKNGMSRVFFEFLTKPGDMYIDRSR